MKMEKISATSFMFGNAGFVSAYKTKRDKGPGGQLPFHWHTTG